MYSLITNFLEPLAYFVYLIALLFRLQVDRSMPLKMLVVLYLIATVLMTDASLRVTPQIPNLWMYNTLLLITVPGIGYYAFHQLKGRKRKNVVIVFTAATLLYFVVRNIVLRHFNVLDSTGLVLLSISVVVFAFMYFHQILTNITDSKLSAEFDFWLMSGYLVNYLGSFFIFLYYNYFTAAFLKNWRKSDSELLSILWGVHNVFLFLSALLTLIGSVWTSFRRPLH